MKKLSTQEVQFLFDQMAAASRKDCATVTSGYLRTVFNAQDLEAAISQIDGLLEACKKAGGINAATELLKKTKNPFQQSLFSDPVTP